jgi:hypothetical protein
MDQYIFPARVQELTEEIVVLLKICFDAFSTVDNKEFEEKQQHVISEMVSHLTTRQNIIRVVDKDVVLFSVISALMNEEKCMSLNVFKYFSPTARCSRNSSIPL